MPGRWCWATGPISAWWEHWTVPNSARTRLFMRWQAQQIQARMPAHLCSCPHPHPAHSRPQKPRILQWQIPKMRQKHRTAKKSSKKRQQQAHLLFPKTRTRRQQRLQPRQPRPWPPQSRSAHRCGCCRCSSAPSRCAQWCSPSPMWRWHGWPTGATTGLSPHAMPGRTAPTPGMSRSTSCRCTTPNWPLPMAQSSWRCACRRTRWTRLQHKRLPRQSIRPIQPTPKTPTAPTTPVRQPAAQPPHQATRPQTLRATACSSRCAGAMPRPTSKARARRAICSPCAPQTLTTRCSSAPAPATPGPMCRAPCPTPWRWTAWTCRWCCRVTAWPTCTT